MRRQTRAVERDPSHKIRERLDVIAALAGIATGARDAAVLERASTSFVDGETIVEGDVIWAFTELVRALVQAVRWVEASWNAEPDAGRYRTAAELRAADVHAAVSTRWPAALVDAAAVLQALNGVDQVRAAADLLGRTVLPPRVTNAFRPMNSSEQTSADEEGLTTTPSAAVLIRFNGEPVLRPAVVTPFALHQFEVEARVESWPEAADSLVLSFLTVHPREFLQVSSVRLTPSAMRQPFEIRVEGDRPPSDPPLGLTARAHFEVAGEFVEARLAGNTTLELVTFDPGTAMPVNMPSAALQLQRMMTELGNAIPNLSPDDRRDVRLLLEGVLRYAHQMLDDRLETEAGVDEAWFQRELRTFLQADRQIGARLSEGTRRAGGITDLGLGRIVLELKVETTSPIALAKASERYAGQATQYASATDSQVSLLAVLDASRKRAPAGVMGNELAWAYPQTSTGPHPALPSMVGVVVVRAGFPRPSDFSR